MDTGLTPVYSVALSACFEYSPRTARPLHLARWWRAAWEAATLSGEPFQILSAGAWSARPKEKLNLQGASPARQMAFNRSVATSSVCPPERNTIPGTAAGTARRKQRRVVSATTTTYELPPNGQGMAALEMLNIMATSQPDKDGPQGTVELHKKIEAMKLAYTDLYRYNGDPHFGTIPVKGLLSKEYAEQRAALIDPQRANCAAASGTPAKSDTTYLAVVDKEGNIASMIQSVYDFFGSGVAVKGVGFLLQDRGGLFVLDPNHPDALAPHKRPFHTIIPAFMERGDEH